MTPDERATFLTDTPRVGVLSIEATGRGPVSSPLWYTVEPDAAITFSVGASSEKSRLLRAAGRATLCVQSEEAPYRYVSIEGPVAEVGASSDASRLARAHRYLGVEFGDAYFASTRDEAELTYSLRPERWASVDYNKVFA
ncbi:MAG TPA: pyridoxamine 5'-phosphate oxidase family protein [Acidimicrobiia bacterium]